MNESKLYRVWVIEAVGAFEELHRADPETYRTKREARARMKALESGAQPDLYPPTHDGEFSMVIQPVASPEAT